MKRLPLLLLLACFMLAGHSTAPLQAQGIGLVDMNISVGFAGRFRDNTWTPVQISLENNGTRGFTGNLVVRPERSRGVTNPVRTPVTLAADTQQMFTLYISLRTFAETVRVELLTEDGLIAADVEARVSAILPRERMYIRVTDGSSRPINLTSAASSGQSVLQADWFVSNLPDRSVGLEAVDLMLISNADTGALTAQQRTAVNEWVLAGGHLIVTGGANWEAAAAGLPSLLPVQPRSSELSSDVGAIARLAGASRPPARVETAITRGSLSDDAIVLAADADGNPLAARRQYGYGLVDYLAFDPTSPPFRGWSGLDGLWFSLVSSRDVRPSWSFGLINPTQNYDAIEILPGVTALPEALAMMGFLLIYVVMIGPVNYLVLSRLGRREFAWFTIPAMIVLFTIVAWVTGFNLRGTEVVLSRLSVVETWPEADRSHVRQMIGFLSPRRAEYDLTLPDNRALRPMLRPAPGGFFSNQSSTVEILQSDAFSAIAFPVDASFMAGFTTDGTIERAPISGSISVTEDYQTGIQRWRGSIRNDMSVPLTDIVLLSRAGVLRLGEPLAAGEIRIIEEQVISFVNAPIPASPLEYVVGYLTPTQMRSISRGRQNMVGPEQTLSEVVGAEQFRSALFFGQPLQTSGLDQAAQRRQTFLTSMMIDQYNSTARGDGIYLLGWTEQAPFEEEVPGSNWRSSDTTLYITKLESTLQTPAGMPDHVAPDQFTWTLIEDESATNATPNLISMSSRGRIAFRLTPVPSAQLDTVDELVVLIERGSASLSNTELRMFNWQSGSYEAIDVDDERTVVSDPERFIGPNNAVQIEIDRFLSAGALAVSRIAVEQYGTRGG